MTDTEILDAIETYRMWVHPAGAIAGWTASGWIAPDPAEGQLVARIGASPRDAVIDLTRQIRAAAA